MHTGMAVEADDLMHSMLTRVVGNVHLDPPEKVDSTFFSAQKNGKVVW